MFSLFTHAILRIACLIVMIHHTGFVNPFLGGKCFDMFDLEKWGGERVKEIDEMINFVEKSAKWLR